MSGVVLGEQLRKWRKAKNLTQTEVANLLGVQFVTVNRWENKKYNPTPAVAKSIKRLMDETETVVMCSACQKHFVIAGHGPNNEILVVPMCNCYSEAPAP